jgi:hypothetical protein
MGRITIYPDKALKEKLLKEAKEQDRSMNNLILLILKRYFKK